MLRVLAEFPWHLLTMALLLAASAFFSASETALFNLSREQLRQFRASRSPFRRLAARLMSDTRRLLVTILFGNMAVNTAFFVMGVVLIHQIAALDAEDLPPWRFAIGPLMPILVILFGEVTPKSVAATMPARIAPLASLPLTVLEYVVLPMHVAVSAVLVGPLTRLVTGVRYPGQGYVTTDELQTVVEMAAREGVVSPDEGDMLIDILKLGDTRVRDIMTPRVDIIACDAVTPMRVVLSVFRWSKKTRILVYEGTMDDIAGIVYAKTAMLNPDRPLATLVRPVRYVPETKTVESLLKMFKTLRIQFAAVVDEYGGLAGLVTLEDCLEAVIGEIEDEKDRPAADPVRKLGESEYLLAGDLSVRSWAGVFDMDLPEGGARYSTVAGFVTSLLGRLPVQGDTVRWRNLEFAVEEIRHRRVRSVRVRLLEHPATSAAGATGQERQTP